MAKIDVVTTILLIGAINLGLGFGLAVLLEHPLLGGRDKALAGNEPSTPCRSEVELYVQEWLARDPERVRIASALLVDVDRCQQLNDRHGQAKTDAVLASLQALLRKVIRQDRGFDRLGPLGGQTYVIFMGDTALRNAATGAERIRQTLAATLFKSEQEEIPVTSSFAVTEWHSAETFDELLPRLRKGLSAAKQAGGNCTAVCGPEEEIRIAPSTPMQASRRMIEVGSTVG